MSETLLSTGLDVGTTTTQLIVSRLTVENRASSFAVPEMQIADRQVIYQSQVHYTPLLGETLVDGEGVRRIVEAEYKNAGITPKDVDTGAVIITGETSRKENARAVLEAMSAIAGDFVVATAGPALESILAAKGSGADTYSRQTGKTVLHMDIGGGTSNLALIADGKVIATGCMNVGGRLLKMDDSGTITYISPVLEDLTPLRPGIRPRAEQVEEIARQLVQGLEMAACLRARTPLLDKLWTAECGPVWEITQKADVISFSGGVADCIEADHRPGQFGDMGVELGQAIKESLLCQCAYRLGDQTIRATVIGAGCHSAQLSGSTVFYKNVALPMKNLPVTVFTAQEQDSQQLPQMIRQRLQQQDADTVVLALPGYGQIRYPQLTALAEKIAEGLLGRPVFVCLEADMAKALGQKLSLLLPAGTPCLCIDRVQLRQESFLDIGSPVGPALPVVVKTLVFKEEYA